MYCLEEQESICRNQKGRIHASRLQTGLGTVLQRFEAFPSFAWSWLGGFNRTGVRKTNRTLIDGASEREA